VSFRADFFEFAASYECCGIESIAHLKKGSPDGRSRAESKFFELCKRIASCKRLMSVSSGGFSQAHADEQHPFPSIDRLRSLHPSGSTCRGKAKPRMINVICKLIIRLTHGGGESRPGMFPIIAFEHRVSGWFVGTGETVGLCVKTYVFRRDGRPLFPKSRFRHDQAVAQPQSNIVE
jgi:hypothetical protein